MVCQGHITCLVVFWNGSSVAHQHVNGQPMVCMQRRLHKAVLGQRLGAEGPRCGRIQGAQMR